MIDQTKEMLLFVASTLVSFGAIKINEDWKVGTALLILGAVVFVGRGFYKKYLQTEQKLQDIKDEKCDTIKNN